VKIAIIGSRDFPQMQQVRDYVRSLPRDTVIVSGAARGVDAVAADEARQLGMKVIEFPADWSVKPDTPSWAIRTNGQGKQYDSRAGMQRNELIVDLADKVVAFWDGESPGTRGAIRLAKRAAKPVQVYVPTTSEIGGK